MSPKYARRRPPYEPGAIGIKVWSGQVGPGKVGFNPPLLWIFWPIMTTAAILARLSALASDTARGALTRYRIPADHAIGVPMEAIKQLARDHGADHALACQLWPTGGYEAWLLAICLADPHQTTAALMQD